MRNVRPATHAADIVIAFLCGLRAARLPAGSPLRRFDVPRAIELILLAENLQHAARAPRRDAAKQQGQNQKHAHHVPLLSELHLEHVNGRGAPNFMAGRRTAPHRDERFAAMTASSRCVRPVTCAAFMYDAGRIKTRARDEWRLLKDCA